MQRSWRKVQRCCCDATKYSDGMSARAHLWRQWKRLRLRVRSALSLAAGSQHRSTDSQYMPSISCNVPCANGDTAPACAQVKCPYSKPQPSVARKQNSCQQMNAHLLSLRKALKRALGRLSHALTRDFQRHKELHTCDISCAEASSSGWKVSRHSGMRVCDNHADCSLLIFALNSRSTGPSVLDGASSGSGVTLAKTCCSAAHVQRPPCLA